MVQLKHLVLVAACALAGCQSTTPPKKQLHLKNEIEQLSLVVEAVNKGYDVEVIWSVPSEKVDLRDSMDESQKAECIALGRVLSAPSIVLHPNEWGTMTVTEQIGGYSPSAAYRIDGELVAVSAAPGITLRAHVAPTGERTVHVKGVLSISRFNAQGNHDIRVFPLDTECTLAERIVVYRKETKVDPAYLVTPEK